MDHQHVSKPIRRLKVSVLEAFQVSPRHMRIHDMKRSMDVKRLQSRICP